MMGEFAEYKGKIDWSLVYRTSPDGIHWSDPIAEQEIGGDCTTAFYNPFRKMWVLSQRIGGHPVGRSRAYLEASTPEALMEATRPDFARQIDGVWKPVTDGESVLWTNADDLYPHHTEAKYADVHHSCTP